MLLLYGGLAILVYVQFGAGNDYRKNKKLCIWIGVFLFLVSALKSKYMPGTDLLSYSKSFYRTLDLTYQRLWTAWRNEEIKDGVFYIVAKFLAERGLTSQAWMGLIALLFAVGAGWFIFRNSAKPFLSLTLMLSLGFFSFTLSGLRQTMALSIVLLFSYDYLLDRRPIAFILSVVAAALFHSSAILFLAAYPVVTIEFGWKQLVLVVGMLVVNFLFPNAIRGLIRLIAWSDNIENYANREASLTWSGFIIQMAVLVFCILFRNDMVLDPYLKWRRMDAFLNCMIVGLCLLIFATSIAEMFRVAYYYNICCIAAVANAVEENKREANRSTMYIIIAICMVAYMLWSRAFFNLKFVWELG